MPCEVSLAMHLRIAVAATWPILEFDSAQERFRIFGVNPDPRLAMGLKERRQISV